MSDLIAAPSPPRHRPPQKMWGMRWPVMGWMPWDTKRSLVCEIWIPVWANARWRPALHGHGQSWQEESQRAKVRGYEAAVHPSDLQAALRPGASISEGRGRLGLTWPWAEMSTLTELPCLGSSEASWQTQGRSSGPLDDLKPCAMSLSHQRGWMYVPCFL